MKRGRSSSVRGTHEVGYARPPLHSRFKRGQSGNPKGRPPKGESMAEVPREIGETTGTDGMPRKRKLLERIWEMAERGDLAAARLILEYVDGKPVEHIEAEVGPAVYFTSDDAAEAVARIKEWQAGRLTADDLDPGEAMALEATLARPVWQTGDE
jgi:hypothetical protein